MKDFMQEAIKEALKAKKKGEVPIGAVVVLKDKIIGRGRNMREKTQNALHHAEIIAINKACKKMKSWRLDDAVIFVTLEPCPMCAGAICNARIKEVIYSAKDSSNNGDINQRIFNSTRLNHKVKYSQGEYSQECSNLLSEFFKEKRKNKN